MKILITSYSFYPDVGGIPSFTDTLAKAIVELGHSIILVSKTPSEGSSRYPYPVIRKPGFKEFYELTKWCDVFYQSNVSLKMAWPLLLAPRPWAVTHHTWIQDVNSKIRWRDHLKQKLLFRAHNIAISKSIALSINAPSTVIQNPYNEAIFYKDPDISKTKDLLFVGRLVSDKGVDTAIYAINHLKNMGYKAHLTIVGEGPGKANLMMLTQRLGLLNDVSFVGKQSGEALRRSYNEHKILLVPSKWHEPFGLVALEGLACGCVVIGSNQGGLPDVIGPFGKTFKNGNSKELAACIQVYLDNPPLIKKHTQGVDNYLKAFRPKTVAKAYINYFESIAS